MKAIFTLLLMSLSLAPLQAEEKGQVLITVLSDFVEDGELQSYPFSGVGVYLDDWQKGNLLGYTDENGQVLVDLPAGENSLSLFKMTSSHSVLQRYNQVVDSIAGEVSEAELHVAAEQVLIRAFYRTDYGEALFVTGDGEYLGEWSKAYKLRYNPNDYTWTFYETFL